MANKKQHKHITRELLHKILDYDPTTGYFTWKVKIASKVVVGTCAGSLHKPSGYIQIKLFGHRYAAHRLAFLYVHGWLPDFVDHDDGCGSHNWIKNLREATQSQNMCNSKAKGSNKFKGVFQIPNGRWRAHIHFNGKGKHLGYFDTAEEAHEFRCLAADMIHGEFSNPGIHKYQRTTNQ